MKHITAGFLTLLLLSFAVSSKPAIASPPAAYRAPKARTEVAPASRPSPTLKAISTLYTRQVTTAGQHEVETNIIALAINGVDHTIGAYMNNYDSAGYPEATSNWEIRTRKSTNLTSWTERIPTKPNAASRTVDPVLAANVYTDGVSPLTVYLGGIGTNGGSNYERTIAVWRSTDGANTWSAPVAVAQSTTSSAKVDKPAITVSWYQPTRGHVFVAYVLAQGSSANRNQNKLYVARSTNGGVSFGTPVLVAQSYLHSPQILVSPVTGAVYVVYVDHYFNKIRMATSTDQGSTWTTEDVTGPTGKFLEVWDDPFITGATCDLQAVTVPHARYNSVRGSIGIVWHERALPNTSSTTDVWFIAKTSAGWSNKVRVNPTQLNDQWMPALDFDSTGNYTVVYYDRSVHPYSGVFKEAWTQIDPLYPTPSILASGFVHAAFDSDPSVFEIGNPAQCFKGEYQDIWYWPYSNLTSDDLGGRFNSFWTGTPSSTAFDNVYLSGLK